jgi:hypothetical protein
MQKATGALADMVRASAASIKTVYNFVWHSNGKIELRVEIGYGICQLYTYSECRYCAILLKIPKIGSGEIRRRGETTLRSRI